MAYTYEDFTRAAEAAGLSGAFDESDMALARQYPEYGLGLLNLRRDLNSAQTSEQRLLADEAIRQLRERYSGIGSDAGSATRDAGGGVPYSTAYDPTKDPVYSSYKRAYLREGERASANALAQSAAATGGIPSSYANIAAQEAGNYYAAKLADIIPTLRQLNTEEEQRQFENALRIYQLTGQITGPLLAYMSGSTAAAGGGGGGGGGGGRSGGSSYSTLADSLAKLAGKAVDTIQKSGSAGVDAVSGAAPSSSGVLPASSTSAAEKAEAQAYLDYLETQGFKKSSQIYQAFARNHGLNSAK